MYCYLRNGRSYEKQWLFGRYVIKYIRKNWPFPFLHYSSQFESYKIIKKCYMNVSFYSIFLSKSRFQYDVSFIDILHKYFFQTRTCIFFYTFVNNLNYKLMHHNTCISRYSFSKTHHKHQLPNPDDQLL